VEKSNRPPAGRWVDSNSGPPRFIPATKPAAEPFEVDGPPPSRIRGSDRCPTCGQKLPEPDEGEV
jgi:hypothetical protein